MSGPTAPTGVDLVAAVCGDRLLVLDAPAGPVLPAVAGCEGWPETPLVIRTAGVDHATVLAPATRLAEEPATTVHLLGLPPGGPDPSLQGAGWLDLTHLERLGHPPDVATAVRAGLAEHTGAAPWPARRPAWYRPGWPAESDAWVDEQLARIGLDRTGPSEMVKIWSLSAVLRVPVSGGGTAAHVYAKATCDHFRAEPAVTRLLASLAPAVVPDVLAVDEDRGWLLMRPFTDGEVEPRPETAPAAARAIAGLQLDLLDHTDELLAAGAPDRRLAPTLAAFERLVTGGIELPLLTPAERQRLLALVPWVARELETLAAVQVPDSIGHGDLHIGNYVADAAGVRMFDWSDAALTLPVLDARLLAGSAGGEHEQPTLDAYAEVWANRLPAVDVAAALELSPVPHLVYQTVSYEGIYRGQEEQSHWEMAGISARLLRRLIGRWEEAGSPC